MVMEEEGGMKEYDDHCDWRRRIHRKQLCVSYAGEVSGVPDYLPGQADLSGEPFHAEERDGQPELPLREGGHLRPGRSVPAV